MSDRVEQNRNLWDRWTPLHRASEFYSVDRFRAGASTLKEPELDWLGDVRDVRLLHLQCHFGLDTLSLARRGARATGVDFSPVAIEAARELADSCGIEAAFVEADVQDLPETLDSCFDLAFSSYGALCWLPDLTRWARGVHRCLAPGGRLALVEFHPLLSMLADDGRTIAHAGLSGAPIATREHGSYAVPDAAVEGTSHTWNHGIGEIVNALVQAGFRVERYDELDYSPWNCFPFTHETEPGKARVRGFEGRLPMLFRLDVSRASEPDKPPDG